MYVLVPQYVVSPSYSDTTGYVELLESNIGAEPTSNIWDDETEYAEDDTVYYIDTSGISNGCWCSYTALQAMTGDDVGKIPEDNADYWAANGAINRYKMFDQYNGTTTINSSGDIVITVHCQAITDIAFLNVQAKSITINAWHCSTLESCDTAEKIIDEQTISLTQQINDFYEYFFKDFDYVRDISEPLEVSLYHNLVVEFTFEQYSSTVDCYVGNIIFGRRYNIGSLQYGVNTGIEDYSRKEFDANFGSHYIQERAYRKTMNCDLLIDNQNINQINSILTQLRAKPTVWQGNQDDIMQYDILLIYGIPASFNIIMQHCTHSECNLEIEGLI